MKHIFISLLVVVFTFAVKAQQDTPFDKKLFKEQKDAFKEAEESYYVNLYDLVEGGRLPEINTATKVIAQRF